MDYLKIIFKNFDHTTPGNIARCMYSIVEWGECEFIQ